MDSILSGYEKSDIPPLEILSFTQNLDRPGCRSLLPRIIAAAHVGLALILVYRSFA